MSDTCAWQYVDTTVVIAFASSTARVVAADMEKLLADLRAHGNVRQVIVSPNGVTPAPAQREAMHRYLEESGARVAVLSSDLLVRGVVTALNWFGLPVRAFPWSQLSAALSYAKVPEAQRGRIQESLHRLQDQVALQRPGLTP